MTSNIQNVGLLTLRAGVGGVLIAHGVQKLFGWLGGAGLTGTAAAFEQMGSRPGRQSAVAAGLGEAGGGALIVLGLFTPAAGAAAAGTIIPAAAVHAPSGFFATGGGYAYPGPARPVRRRPGSHRAWRLVARCPAGSRSQPTVDGPAPCSHPPRPPRWFCSVVARHERPRTPRPPRRPEETVTPRWRDNAEPRDHSVSY